MAIKSPTLLNDLRITAGLPSITNFTIMGWFLIPVLTSAVPNTNFFNIDGGAGEFIYVGADADGLTTTIYVDDGGGPVHASGPLLPRSGINCHYAYVKSGNTHTFYLSSTDGLYDVTAIVTLTHAFAVVPVDVVVNIDLSPDGEQTRVSNLKVWEAALTPTEIRLERDKYAVTKTTSLYSQVPLRREGAYADISGGGHDWTPTAAMAFASDLTVAMVGLPLAQQNADWVWRSDSAVATGSVGLTITKPAGVVDGDLMFMVLTHKGAAYATMPAGWTLITRNISGSTRHELHWKRASGEGANYAVTGLLDTACGFIKAYVGQTTGGDIVASSGSSVGLASNPTLVDLTLTIRDALILQTCGSGNNQAQGSSISSQRDPALYNIDTQGGTATGTDSHVAAADAISQATGTLLPTTGSHNWFASCPEWVTLVAALIPDPDLTLSPTTFFMTLRSTGAALYGEPQGAWSEGSTHRDNRGQQHWTWLLSPFRRWGGLPSAGLFVTGSDGVQNPETILLMNAGRMVIGPLAAGTVQGDITINMPVKVLNIGGGTTAGVYALHVYVCAGTDLDSVRGVCVNTAIGAAAWTTTLTWRGITETMAPVSSFAGDYLIIEVGARITTTPITEDGIYQARMGSASFSGVGQIAGPTSGAAISTDLRASWVSFTVAPPLQNVTVTVPANSTRAAASAVGALPFTTAAIETTVVNSPNRELWWAWTATFTGRIFIGVLGSNYGMRLAIYEDGTTSPISFGGQDQWIQAAQAIIYADVTEGVDYWFQVAGKPPVAIPTIVSPTNSGGSLTFFVRAYSAPQIDDLFINCQHNISVRGTGAQMVDHLGDFYGLTPTGAAIDTSQRPMVSLNGGVTVTDYRLYICLFGDDGLVEIVDLATLNVGESEIDYIADPIRVAIQSQNLGSCVLDRAGNLYLGWFGDHYDVIGQLSSPNACAIRVLGATHGDNQPSAPWPAATAFVVDQDVGGTDYIDIDSTNTKIIYTSSGQRVLQCSAVDGSQLPDFALVPVAAGPRPGCRGLRFLQPGDGSFGALVTNGANVALVDKDGGLVRFYEPLPAKRYRDIDKVEITSDGRFFWCSDQYSASIAKFDIQTGEQLADVWTHLPAGQFSGFALYGGYRAGTSSIVPAAVTLPIGRVVGTLWALHRFDIKPRTEQSG